jgi:hypothetical protein
VDTFPSAAREPLDPSVVTSRSRRSICRGLIARNSRSISRPIPKRLRIHGIHAGSIAFRRTDQGYPAASHPAVQTASLLGP